jgi:hypothetical protein
MPNIFFRRTALIALAFSLALTACVQETRYAPSREGGTASSEIAPSREGGAAGNQEEAMGAPATEGDLHKDQHAQNPPSQYRPGFSNANTPVAITCAVPGPKPRPILVPAGRNPTDFCPTTAITYHLPVVTGAGPPAWPEDKTAEQRP